MTLPPSTLPNFLNGIVFGFDLGTGSIGFAVRNGREFLETGSFICDSDIGALDTRNGLRRQKRTLRSKKQRRKWIAEQLVRIGLPKPSVQWTMKDKKESREAYDQRTNPVILRCRALAGEKLEPEQLHVAVAHLWKRRGYEAKLPFSTGDGENAGKDEWKGTISPTQNKEAFQNSGCEFPAQFLRDFVGDVSRRQRSRVWRREDLEKEFRAITKAQPLLQKEIEMPVSGGNKLISFEEWLLYGDGRRIEKHEKQFRVFFKNSEARNPGVLGIKWPRFNNRSPGLDVLRPYDEKGRPQHVVSRDNAIARKAMWHMAIANFRVIDLSTGKKVAPDADSLKKLQDLWRETLPKKQREAWDKGDVDFDVNVAIEDKRGSKGKPPKKSPLHQWAELYAERYALVEGQQELSSVAGEGRTKYSTPTLNEFLAGNLEGLQNTPQPILVRAGQTAEEAMGAFLAEVRSPVVRHRLLLFSRLLARLTKEHGKPDLIVIEAARSFALGHFAKKKRLKEIADNQKSREEARTTAKNNGWNTSKNALLRYRLWKEVTTDQGHCPFCSQPITQAQFLNGEADIAHLVPQAVRKCDEFYNLTVAHSRCNRMDMQNKIARDAFPERWHEIEAFARKHFTGKKLELILAKSLDEALEMLDTKEHLCQTAYIAKLVRRLCVIHFGWQAADGRDPSDQEGNMPSKQILISNGSITSMLRDAWGLNTLLHGQGPKYTREQWKALTLEQQKQVKADNEARRQKNRGDHRHHAIDAMVLSCTLPWLARKILDKREPDNGELLWWTLDPQTRERRAWHPIFPKQGAFRDVVQKELGRMEVRHHVAQATHRQPANTTIYSKRGLDNFVAREPLTTLSPKDLIREGNRPCRVHPEELGRYLWKLWSGYADDFHAYLTAARGEWLKSYDFAAKRDLKSALKDFQSRLCFVEFHAWRSGDRAAPPALPDEPKHPVTVDGKMKLVIEKDSAPQLDLPKQMKLFSALPEDFQKRLCFTAFQKWREKQTEEASFPGKVLIPIVKVRYIAKIGLGTAVPGPKTMPGKVWVKRTDFREVRLMPSATGEGYIPVFIPLGKHYEPYSPFGDFKKEARPPLVIRKRQIIKLMHDYSHDIKRGEYVVEVMGTNQLKMSFAHVARSKESRKAFGLPSSGYQPYWKQLIPALGFAFPANAQGIVDDEDANDENNNESEAEEGSDMDA